MKKIAIYHGLERGGALMVLNRIKQNLLNKGYLVDVYSSSKKIHYVDNFIGEILTAYLSLKNEDKKLSVKLNTYDYVLVFPSIRTQFPNILRYINVPNCYFYQESRREFFENTSYDHFSLRRLILRVLRLPICLLDYVNSKYITNCISNSYYSQFIAKKIYKLDSKVIYPGYERIRPIKYKINLTKEGFSIGPIIKTKGHDFTLTQISKVINYFTLIGNIDTTELNALIKKHSSQIKYQIIHKPHSIKKILKKINCGTLYFANNYKEPFGLATLDATVNNFYTLGKNQGGTPEIINMGINGFLYPPIQKIAKKVLSYTFHQKENTFYKNSKYNWSRYVEKILIEINSHLSHHPHSQQPGKSI